MRSYSLLSRHSGNAALFRAVELSIISSLAGCPLHLHAEGLRGTGKTTIMRSARGVLPTIRRVKSCPYNCDPGWPHCPQHRGMDQEQLACQGVEDIPMPFWEISHSAKVGTVAGSIDLGRLSAAETPTAALLPGTLARAHRGIVFVDEINRLADTSPELTDLLLDAMGTRPGRLQIEETGLPTVELAIQVTVWAASNPDEEPGALEDVRRQLADRFDLQVGMGKPRSRETVLEILEAADLATWGNALKASGLGGTGDPEELAKVFSSRSPLLPGIRIPPSVRKVMADLYLDCGLESLRTIEAAQFCVRAACALEGRDEVRIDDLRGVLPLILSRRVDQTVLERFLARLDGEALPRPAAGARQSADDGDGPGTIPGELGQVGPGPGGAGRTCGAGTGDSGWQSDPDSQPADIRPQIHGLDGIFGRLARIFRGGGWEFPGAGSGGGRIRTAPGDGHRGGAPGGSLSGIDPASAPILAPPVRARALAEIPAEMTLRWSGHDGTGCA
jgi:magnesium chelatase subunit I